MGEVAGYIVAAIAAGAAANEQSKAQKAIRKGEKEAAAIKQRSAELENQRRARRAIAARRVQQAELIAAAQITNAGGLNSGVSGAVGSLGTQTAANVGAANTSFAADVGAQSALFRRQKQADKYNTNAAYAGVVSNLALGYSARRTGGGTKPVPKAKPFPPITIDGRP